MPEVIKLVSPSKQQLSIVHVIAIAAFCFSAGYNCCFHQSTLPTTPPLELVPANPGKDTGSSRQMGLYSPNVALPVPVAVCSSMGNSSFMTLHDVDSIVHTYYNSKLSTGKLARFKEIGHELIKRAAASNQVLVTVQIGGMDGYSNDPMYNMYIKQGRDSTDTSFPKLKHWLPVVVEPVPINFEALSKTYKTLQQHATDKLECSIIEPWAVSYDTAPPDLCTFCRFDTSETAQPQCKRKPDWMKLQLGTLECGYSKQFFNVDFDACIIQDKVKCGPVSALLHKTGLPVATPIAILQVDVEGYEYMLLPGLLNELPDHMLPLVIHFEHKVMRHKDQKNGTTTRAADVNELLRKYGYVLYDQDYDYLALRVPGATLQEYNRVPSLS